MRFVYFLLAMRLFALATNAQTPPKKLLIYYGYPSSFNYPNNGYSMPNVINDMAQYQYVVLGDGLSKVTHSDHVNAQTLINSPATNNTAFFGYIDLGACYIADGETKCTQNLPLSEIQIRIDEWKAMGIDGIFFDDYGYDFGVTRTRQNAAVQYAHNQNLSVVANGWNPDHVFGRQVDPTFNPNGLATVLDNRDIYLSESFLISESAFTDPAAWQSKAALLENYRQQINFRIWSVTTTDTLQANAPQSSITPLFSYAWHGAWLYGHEATGWGEFKFASNFPNNGIAPFRPRPAPVTPGILAGPVRRTGNLLTRYTNTGQIRLNSSTHEVGFAVCGLCQSTGSGSWQTSSIWSVGRLPLACDLVDIQPGHTIFLNAGAEAGVLRLRGKLQSGTYRLQLRVY